jgi:peptidoglycan hydrolase-like protein with peptidoglycan-binding domain
MAVDYKAVQARLNALGTNPPLTVDGIYGPASKTAVMAFQKSKGIAVDGVAGPQTLGLLGITGLTAAPIAVFTAKPAAKSTDPNNIHVRAKAAADAIPGLTPAESAFMRSVGWHETDYGNGWGTTPPPNGGAGSFNMGAITTTTPGPLDFQHVDSRNDGNGVVQYTTWFKGYPSFQAGMQGLADTVLKPNVRAAIAANKDPQKAFAAGVAAMYANHYFLGIHPRNTDAGNAANVQDYMTAVTNAFSIISENTGESIAIAAGIGAGAVAVIGLLVWGALKFFGKGI